MRNPDLAAPGAHIRSLRAPGSAADVEHPEGFVDDARFLGSGSSQSAAVTSGAVALLLSAHPELSPDQVKQLLVDSATSVDASETIVGAGVLDIAAAAKATPGDATPRRPRLAVQRRPRHRAVVDGLVVDGQFVDWFVVDGQFVDGFVVDREFVDWFVVDG